MYTFREVKTSKDLLLFNKIASQELVSGICDDSLQGYLFFHTVTPIAVCVLPKKYSTKNTFSISVIDDRDSQDVDVLIRSMVLILKDRGFDTVFCDSLAFSDGLEANGFELVGEKYKKVLL